MAKDIFNLTTPVALTMQYKLMPRGWEQGGCGHIYSPAQKDKKKLLVFIDYFCVLDNREMCEFMTHMIKLKLSKTKGVTALNKRVRQSWCLWLHSNKLLV